VQAKTKIDQVLAASAQSVTVLRFSGDISSTSHEDVVGAYERIAKSLPVLLDFSHVEYINSSGIALVIQVLMEAYRSGQKVSAFGLTPHFQKVFTMVGITKYAPLFPDEESAKASL
jgi:anti-sigma B factor antagonist